MKAEKVNNELMNRIGFSKPEEIEDLRKIYNKIIEPIKNEEDEKAFYYSVLGWWFDGSTGAAYYEYWLKNNWK